MAIWAVASSTAATTYELLSEASAPGSGDGELSRPGRAAVDFDSGNVFVADTGNDRVQVFSPTADSVAYTAQFGAGVLSDPIGVAVDQGTGAIYVSDTGNGRIVRFDDTLALDTAISPSEIGGYGDVEVDPTSGDLLIADTVNQLVHRVSTAGAHLGSFDGSSSGTAFTGVRDLAIDPANGDVLVADVGAGFFEEDPFCCYLDGSSRIERFSADGSTHLATVGPVAGAGLIAVDPNNGRALVGDVVPSAPDGYQASIKAFEGGSEVQAFAWRSGTLTGIAVDDGSDRLYEITDRVTYTNYGDEGSESIQVFESVLGATDPPVVTIDPVSDVAEFSATVSGTVDPEGFPADWHFEYAVAGSGDWQSTSSQSAGDGGDPVPVQTQLTGLAPDTAYDVRLSATNGAGTTESSVETFTTEFALAPTATIAPPADVTETSAKFVGSVNPQGYVTQWRFDYRRMGAPDWQSTAPRSAGDGTGDVTVEAAVEDLQPNRDYEVRLVATSPAGIGTAGPQAFGTASVGPAVDTRGLLGRTTTSATLRGAINPKSRPTAYWFEYGADTSYGATVPAGAPGDAGSGTEAIEVSRAVTGLQPGATYHYRLVADNGVGAPVVGEDRTFTTYSGAASPTRVLEQVSPRDKNGGDVQRVTSRIWAAESGDGIAYTSPTAFAGSQSSGVVSQYLSRRGATGWSTKGISPPGPSVGALNRAPQFEYFTDDLDKALYQIWGAPPGVVNGRFNVFLWDEATDGSAFISPSQSVIPEELLRYPRIVGGSEDLSHAVFESEFALDDRVTPDTNNIYEYVDGSLRLVNLLPETDHGPYNGAVAPTGATAGMSRVGDSFLAQREVSEDGSRIFFTSDPDRRVGLIGDDAGHPGGRLYVRQDGATTTWISKSQRSEPDPVGERPARFGAITPDGSTAFFTSAEKLTDNATARYEGDSSFYGLYRYELSSGNLTELTAGAGVGAVLRVLGASDDGSRAYFIAGSRPNYNHSFSCDDCHIYLWHDGDIDRVTHAPLSPHDYPMYNSSSSSNDQLDRVSRDGGSLALVSHAALTGQAQGTCGVPARPCTQVYLYDAERDELTCASCPVDGGAPTSDATVYADSTSTATIQRRGTYRVRPLSEDGRYVFFHTADALAAGDGNGLMDAYQYDSATGKATLLSKAGAGAESYFADAGADGRDVFIWTRAQLTDSDIDQSADLYDARIDGGFPSPPVHRPCAGSECQGTPTGAPEVREPSSDRLRGAGNLEARTRQAFSFTRLGSVQLARLARGRTASVRVRVNRAGRITARLRARIGGRERIVANASGRAARAGTVKLRLKLSRPARRALVRRGRLHARLSVGFAGDSRQATIRLRLPEARSSNTDPGRSR